MSGSFLQPRFAPMLTPSSLNTMSKEQAEKFGITPMRPYILKLLAKNRELRKVRR